MSQVHDSKFTSLSFVMLVATGGIIGMKEERNNRKAVS
jgi:hypothetical protein